MNFTHPWVLALALPAWIGLFAALLRPGARRPGGGLRTGLSALAAGLLVAALAGPSLRSSSAGLAPGRVAIVQDVSKSMTLARRADPARALSRMVADFPGGRAGLVQFAGNVGTVVDPLSPEASHLASASAFPPDTGAEAVAPETDIAAGLQRAGSLLGPEAGLVVLYSDGRATRGDAVRAATALAARGLQVHALLPDLSPPPDVRIVSLEPLGQAAGQAVRLRVRLASTVAADAEVRLVRRARPDGAAAALEPLRVRVEPAVGAAAVIDDAPPEAGLYTYTATAVSSADRVPENNEASCLVRVGAVREVLYVYEGPRPRAALEWLRAHAPADVRIAAAAASQTQSLPDADADIVVLDNVPAWALGRASEDLLAARVTRGGMGLLALGGDSSFSAGGYGTSLLEGLLPVSSRTAERPPLELVLVVDSSGSMNETVGSVQKLTLAKQAILSLRQALSEGDRVGIIAFAGEPRVISPPCPVSEWPALERRLVALQAGGGTRITPAVEAALSLLGPAAKDPRTVRHILLLSDGRSEDFAVDRLLSALRAAGASASAVATGADADAPRLEALAAGTGGRLYRPDDLARLAETFLRDMAYVRGEGLREEKRPARWVDASPVWPRAGAALPDVPAFNATRAKEGAAVEWAADAGEKAGGPAPLLASWRRGSGKVAAMPWPVSAATGPWLTDGRLGQNLADVLAYLAGPRAPVDWSARLVAPKAGAPAGHRVVRVERRAEALEKAASGFTATVFATGGEAPVEIALPEIAPGIYEADLGGDAATGGMVVVHAGGTDGGAMSLAVPGAPPLEYAGFGADRERLEKIVRAGGGAIHDSPESVVRAVERLEAAALVPVGIYLVWAAGLVVAAQVALRLMGRL